MNRSILYHYMEEDQDHWRFTYQLEAWIQLAKQGFISYEDSLRHGIT